MHRLLATLSIRMDERLYLKDPESSEIGREILRVSIELIYKDGLENFTFKKLATRLRSTESTIYRYFHNKQQLMMYLASWYWAILEWKLAFATTNVENASKRLDNALMVISTPMENIKETPHIDESALHKIVVNESFKAFVVKNLNKKEREGYFSAYSNLINRLSSIITDLQPSYKFPKALASTLIETAHYQHFIFNVLPDLTDIGKNHFDLLHHIAFKALDQK